MATNSSNDETKIEVYKADDVEIPIRIDGPHETVWVTQSDMSTVFGVDVSVITKHISNIFGTGEVDEESSVQKVHIAPSTKPTKVYSLDVVISVGYRANSRKASSFRRWATRILRDYHEKGFVLNPERLMADPEALTGC